MSLISLLDEQTALVDLPWLAVETVELLQSRGFKFIQIDDSERDTLACNVLALGEKRLLAIEENRKTNDRLRQAGFDVRTFPGSELCINGSGGPTCLTRPLLARVSAVRVGTGASRACPERCRRVQPSAARRSPGLVNPSREIEFILRTCGIVRHDRPEPFEILIRHPPKQRSVHAA